MRAFNGTYFSFALLLLGVEVLIARYLHDALIRPYGGDFLVVILLYCLVRSVLATPRYCVAGAVLLLAYAVEVSQYFGLLKVLGWQQQLWAQLLLGSQFAWLDLVAYTGGLATVLALEHLARPRGRLAGRQRP